MQGSEPSGCLDWSQDEVAAQERGRLRGFARRCDEHVFEVRGTMKEVELRMPAQVIEEGAARTSR